MGWVAQLFRPTKLPLSGVWIDWETHQRSFWVHFRSAIDGANFTQAEIDEWLDGLKRLERGGRAQQSLARLHRVRQAPE